MEAKPFRPHDYLDALLSLPKLWGGSVSRDGKWAAWMWMGAGKTIDVYAAPTDASSAPIRMTESDQNTYVVSWLPQSDGLIVAQDHDGDERLRLFRVELNRPQRLVALTEDSPPYYIRGGQISPDGRWLIYAANVDYGTWQAIEPWWVYRHDLQTGERKALARPAKGTYYFPALNRSGSHILYNRKDLHPAGYQLWVVDIDGREDREVFSAGDDKKVYGSWLPDGERILIRAETDTHFRVGIWALTDGSIQWLIDDPSRYIEAAHMPFGSDLVVISEVREARLHSSLLNVQTGTETLLSLSSGNLLPISPTADGLWIGKYYSSQAITDLVRFDPQYVESDAFQSVTGVHTRTGLRSAHLVKAEDFRWEADDGLRIQGWLYRTPHPVKGTVVTVHGGPTAHSEDALDDQIQYLVSQGFNVLDPNYRGSTGFNRAFTEAIKADGWGGREQTDIKAGIRALIQHGIATPGKVGITGTSYGGYSSWHAITHFEPDLIAAAAPICGMTDLVVDYETTRPDLRPYSAEMMGGTPEDVPERYYERSPIHFVDQIKGRLLIVQGLQDPNVTPENVRAVKQALDSAGIEYELLTFDNEGHGIDRPENLKILYTHLVDFFTQAFSDNQP